MLGVDDEYLYYAIEHDCFAYRLRDGTTRPLPGMRGIHLSWYPVRRGEQLYWAEGDSLWHKESFDAPRR